MTFQTTCSGDSGGPIFFKDKGKTYLVGITSKGQNGAFKFQGKKMYVPSKPWIIDIIFILLNDSSHFIADLGVEIKNFLHGKIQLAKKLG